MTALIDEEQMNSLIWLLEKLLQESREKEENLKVRCSELIKGLFDGSMDTVLSAQSHRYEFWLEEVRSLDLVMAVCRMRKCRCDKD